MADLANGFLQMPGINGNAEMTGYEDWIVIKEMKFGVTQEGEWEEKSPKGKITKFHNIVLMKPIDCASPRLSAACAHKDKFDTATVALVASQDTYYKLELEKVLIRSVKRTLDAGNPVPCEIIELACQAYTESYGTERAGYDLATQQKK